MLAAFSWLTDPEVFEVNKEKPHSDHTFYTKNGDLRQNLNGTWKFHYSEHPDSRPADFYRTDYDVTGFEHAVPVGGTGTDRAAADSAEVQSCRQLCEML